MFMEFDSSLAAGFFTFIGEYVGLIFEYFLKPFSRFHWAYALPSLGLAVVAWMIYESRQPAGARKGLVSFLFPKDVWLHRSAILDYKYVLFDKMMIGIIGGTVAVILGSAATDKSVGEMAETAMNDTLWVVLLYTACLLLTEDLFRYGMHRLMHQVPFLWEFHKVHHSPEVLVPFSLLRSHPVNGLLNLVRTGAAIGLVSVVFLVLFPGKISVITIFGVNVGRVLFNICGAHLRHSHVWLGFGPVLSRVFISPCMHQVHHSALRHHWDKNFGSQFALWDWMFGTIYIPKAEERHTIRLGLGDEETNDYRTVRDLYLVPFRKASRLVRERRALSWTA